jgi:hypothetical protein
MVVALRFLRRPIFFFFFGQTGLDSWPGPGNSATALPMSKGGVAAYWRSLPCMYLWYSVSFSKAGGRGMFEKREKVKKFPASAPPPSKYEMYKMKNFLWSLGRKQEKKNGGGGLR